MNTNDEQNEALWNRIQEIDLGPIRYKLVNCAEGAEPWKVEKVAEIEPAYR